MSDIAHAAHDAVIGEAGHILSSTGTYRVSRAVVEAVTPLIERAVREQVARDIEARLADVRKTSAVGRQFGLDEAARIARGEP